MHATVALACMQRGKHVYCEKPLTRTPWEARLLLNAAAKYKVATQMGNQGFSHECNRVAAEIVWSGAIGDVTEAHVSTTPGTHPTGLHELPPEEPVPAQLDWDLWLGGAAPRPFSSYYVPYNWRGFLDFGTGQIGNWATHTAGPGADRAATRRAHQPGMHHRQGPQLHHLSRRRHCEDRISRPRRNAGRERLLPRWPARRRFRRVPCARHGQRNHSSAGQ